MATEVTAIIRFEDTVPDQEEFEKVLEARWYGAFVIEYEDEEV